MKLAFVADLSVRLEGKAEVHWTRKVSRKSRIGRIHKTLHYRDVERYFLQRIKLLGDGSGIHICNKFVQFSHH